MSKRIEIEEKYFCTDSKRLLELIKPNALTLVSESVEKDEYFTDIDSRYIKNRTCLRIRSTDRESVEMTFKGKSHELNNLYIKEESNVKIDIDERDDIIKMLHSLGYYSYSVVDKNRKTYSKHDDNLQYNVMVDEIRGIGLFVEFEILCVDNGDISVLKDKLNQFVSKFSDLKLESADIPYRDFVAKKIYDNILPDGEIKTLLLDLDGTLINSENIFLDSFRRIISNNYNYEISDAEYKNNELDQNNNLIGYLKLKKIIPNTEPENDIMQQIYAEYEIEFIKMLSKDDTILNFELLKQLQEKGMKLALVTTSKRKFVEMLINTLSIEKLFDYIVCREDVDNLKPDKEAYEKAIGNLKTPKENILAVEDSNRGLESATDAGIKVIHISKKDTGKFVTVDSFSRLAFILLNHR